MVVRQSIDHRVKRDEARRRDDTRLPHPAAERPPPSARRIDERIASSQCSADARAEPLREIDGHRIDAADEVAGWDAERNGGVEETGAVDVDREIVVPRNRDELGLAVGPED